MYVKSFLLAAGLLALTGCVGNVTIPSLGLDHPANPQAAAAPLPPPPTVPKAKKVMVDMQGMQGMDHGSMGGMKHGSMQRMQEMDHGAMQAMDHESMKGMGGMNMAEGSMEGRDHGSMRGKDDMEGMEHEGHGAHEHGGEHGPSAAGQPGDESQVDRTVEVTAYDSMSYKPDSLTVKPGETIRFVVTNAGKIRHEFVIGTPEEQREHEQMMQQMPNMVHEDPGSATLEPGETQGLVWQFSNPGVIEFACHVPGHYPAGMVGKVQVGTAGTSGEDQPNMNMDDMQGMDHGSMKGMDGMEGEQHAH
jgi:uncharacterized cupredoxin-like copper-binding protein